MLQRLLGMTAAFGLTDLFFHSADALAMSLRAETMSGRIGAVMLAVVVIIAAMIASRLWFPRSFFHGFTVATGLFLSFDIVLLHWIFQVHRITSGPEANVLEPIFVAIGIVFVAYGYRSERGKSALAG